MPSTKGECAVEERCGKSAGQSEQSYTRIFIGLVSSHLEPHRCTLAVMMFHALGTEKNPPKLSRSLTSSANSKR